MATIDEILNSKGSGPEGGDQAADSPQPVVHDKGGAPMGEAEGTADRTRDEQGRFAKNGDLDKPNDGDGKQPGADGKPKGPGKFQPKDKQSPPPGDEQDIEATGTKAALWAARERIRQLEAKGQQQPPPKPVDLYEDPDRFRSGILSEAQQIALNERLNMSEMMIRDTKDDAEAVIAEFMAATQSNPALREQAMKQAHPYKYIYDEGKRMLAMKEIGDPVAYKEKLRAELLAELGNQGKPAEEQPAPVQLPTSLANARSAAPRNATTWQGPTPINDILARKR